MLYIVATPVGNLDDITTRALKAFRTAEVIACEDTRRTRMLLSHFNIPRPEFFISYRQENEQKAGKRLMEFLKKGKTVALCSDGGYPGISDAGYRLIRAVVENEIEFQVIPGACAVQIALLTSGLPSSSYTFKGFAPRKKSDLRRFFEKEKDMPHTMVVFESPHRTLKTLESALDVFGDRQAAVCIELTKKFERVTRAFLSELVAEFTGQKIKGEVTIVIAGNNRKFCR